MYEIYEMTIVKFFEEDKPERELLNLISIVLVKTNHDTRV